MVVYKVVEVNPVAEDTLEQVLNEWTGKGWQLERMQFSMRESSNRPSMAFIIFNRQQPE